MRLPGGPARLLRTRDLIALAFALTLAAASLMGFVWADRTVTVVIDGDSHTVRTRASDVAAALQELGVTYSKGDLVDPAPSVELSDGDVVVVRHAVRVTIEMAGERLAVRVLGKTVADALVVAGLDPTGGARTSPEITAALSAGQVIRVQEAVSRVVQVEEIVPFDVELIADRRLPLGVRRVVRPGVPGRSLRVYQIVSVGGVPALRTLKFEKLLSAATDAMVAVGGRVPPAPKTAARESGGGGPAAPGSKVRVTSTAYTPWDNGCVGHTILRRGYAWVEAKKARYDIPDGWGIIAVDPSVIRLGSRVYVPGYGYAVACDTGGAIDGRKIDVCFWGPNASAPTDADGGQRQVKQAMAAAHEWGAVHSGRPLTVTILGK